MSAGEVALLIAYIGNNRDVEMLFDIDPSRSLVRRHKSSGIRRSRRPITPVAPARKIRIYRACEPGLRSNLIVGTSRMSGSAEIPIGRKAKRAAPVTSQATPLRTETATAAE
jgi:hypothetical protein